MGSKADGGAGPVDVAAVVEAALRAFDDGIVKVFVGDREADGPVELADGADVLANIAAAEPTMMGRVIAAAGRVAAGRGGGGPAARPQRPVGPPGHRIFCRFA